MEACATAHYWARELAKLGHEVRLMPTKDVKAYVKRTRTNSWKLRFSSCSAGAVHTCALRDPKPSAATAYVAFAQQPAEIGIVPTLETSTDRPISDTIIKGV
jgi:hypothetical protein